MFRILIVEDDRALSDGICLALQDKEHDLVQAEDLKQADQILFRENGINGVVGDIDLVILDLNLPDGNGLELLKKLRKYSKLPVIILTANDMEVDIVTGLESGADDYITKPFSLMVLRARVNARLRNIVTETQTISRVDLGPFRFSFEEMEYFRDGEEIILSRTEQKLLRILVCNCGKAVSKERLLDAIWTDNGEFVDANALPVAVKRLREKIETNPSEPEYIKNVYGIGYMWNV